MSIDANSTRKLDDLAEALELADSDLFYVVRFPYTLDTSLKVQYGTLRAALASLIGSGDVVGPTSAVDGDLVLFDGTSGRTIKSAGVNPAFLLNRNNHTGQQAFSTLTSLPTTLAGYGITDGSPFIHVLEEGVEITPAALSFNFTGVGVTATQIDGAVTVNVTGSGDMVLSAIQTILGAKTFNDNTLKLFNATSTFVTTLKTTATADNVMTIPAGGSDTFVLLGLTQTITGQKKFNDGMLRLFNSGGTFLTTLKSAPAVDNTITIPTSADDSFVLVALAQTLTNKTLTSPTLNTPAITSPQIDFGTNANGDIIYRDGAGLTARLPIGTARQALRVSSALLPEWASPDYRLLGFVTGVNLNAAAPIDLTGITIDATKYIPLYAVVYKASADGSTAQLGIYTAAAGGGTAVVTPAALANMNASGKMQVLTLTNLGNAPLTAATLIPRLTVAQGSACTVDIAIYGIQLPS
jgi:hypothetical protein